MQKVLFTVCFICLYMGFVYSQDTEEIYLKKQTEYVKNDTNYVLNAISLGSFYQNYHIDSVFILVDNAMHVSKKINFLKGEALSLNLKGVVLGRLGNYSQALQAFLDAIKICEKINAPKVTAMVLINLGDLYFKQGDLHAALNYTSQAKAISQSIGDKLNISASYINIGNYYEALNLLDSARINSQYGFEYASKINNENYMGICLNNIANIFAKTKEYPLANAYYRSALPYYTKSEDYDGLSECYLGLAKIFDSTEVKDSIMFYAKKSLNIAISQKVMKYIYDASKFISQYYQNNQQIDSAFAYQQIMITAKDSLFSQEKVKQLQNLTINETLRQQEIAEEKLREAEERKNNLQYMAIAAFIFLFALSIILISRRRIKLTTINFMVTVALLLIFEYISLFIHPYISEWTHHSPIYMLLILVVIAAILVPGHHRLEHWIKETLSHKIIHPRTRKMKMKRTEDSDEG